MNRAAQELFARRWADAIAGASYVSMGHDELVASEAILPSATLSMAEVRALLHDGGLVEHAVPAVSQPDQVR